MKDSVRVGLLGCGTVGAATAAILLEHADDIAGRAGVPVVLARVAVRDASKQRSVSLPAGSWTTDALDVVRDPDIDVVVETIGGIDPAKELIVSAIRSGKHVVTANKELLSTHGEEVTEAARRAGVEILFEGAVGGGIPIVRPLKESLAGDRVKRVIGIVNGTTNFVLTRMSEFGVPFDAALEEATRLGYAEADPSADVDGFDAASKLAILASIAFDARVVAADVHREGISGVTVDDVSAAHDLGYEIKLVALGQISDSEVSVRVHPAMLPKTHPLAAVRDVYNAVFVEAERSGELMFFGRGAGGDPTGSAVVGDVVEAARAIVTGSAAAPVPGYHRDVRIQPQRDATVRYYIVLSVADRPGVLSKVAGVFADNDISIASVRQEGRQDRATLRLITHIATEGQHLATLDELARLEEVKSVVSKLRVEGTSETP